MPLMIRLKNSKDASYCKIVMGYNAYNLTVDLYFIASNSGNERKWFTKFFIATAKRVITSISDKQLARGYFAYSF